MSSDSGKPSVGLVEPESDEACLRATLRERFALTEAWDRTCEVRIVGPRALAEGGAGELRRLRQRFPGSPLIAVVARDTDSQAVRECFRAGASEVLWSSEAQSGLEPAVTRALEQRSGRPPREAEAQRMALELGKRARDLESALGAVRDAYDQTLSALVTALDHRERETACHSQRVAAYAVRLGLEAGIEGEDLEDLYRGALLHDIGKVGMPDAVLLNPGELDPEEWEIMRLHAQRGAELTGKIGFLSRASAVPLAHHEAWDGSGYPRGLRDVEIPLHARIFAIVDSYDAIRSERRYKGAESHETAVERLREAAGRRLDPELVETFVTLPAALWIRLDALVDLDWTFRDALAACQNEPAQAPDRSP